MPGLKFWIEQEVVKARKTGYITMIYGTRRYIKNLHNANRYLREKAERGVINTIIQGSAGEVMKIAMVRMQKQLDKHPDLDCHILLQVHDELLMEAPESNLPELSGLIREAFEFPLPKGIPPIPCDIEVGYENWGTKTPYEIPIADASITVEAKTAQRSMIDSLLEFKAEDGCKAKLLVGNKGYALPNIKIKRSECVQFKKKHDVTFRIRHAA